MPLDESVERLPTSASPGIAGGGVEDPEAAMDSFDVVDERTSLLRAEGGTVSQAVEHGSGTYHTPEADGLLSPLAVVDSRVGASNVSLASSSSEDDVEWVDAAEERALTATSQSASSTPRQMSSTHQISESLVTSPAAPVTLVPSSVPTVTTGADMYHWMKRQQDFTASRLQSQQHHAGGGVFQSRPPSLSQESWTFAGASEMSHDDSFDMNRQRFVTHSAFQLADAQVTY